MIWWNENEHMTVAMMLDWMEDAGMTTQWDGGMIEWNRNVCCCCKFYHWSTNNQLTTGHHIATTTKLSKVFFMYVQVPESTMYRCWCCIVLSLRVGSLSVLCDEIVLLDDVIARRLFKALLPRINVLLVRIAGLPAVKIESPAEGERRKT